ncbi:lipopolysaccharide biosynthesis protein RfbH, partial [Candidatus Margulisiibacteriota bacterium]
MDNKIQELKNDIFKKVEEYYSLVHSSSANAFDEQKPNVRYAGRVFDEKEMLNAVDACLDFWLTSGRFSKQFEQGLASFLGVKHCSLVNSGSSANLLAFMALTSPLLGEKQIKKGDEVITVAAGFPTTVAPVLQYGAVPVFADIKLQTYNIDPAQMQKALSPKTKAVMLAHTLGNPFNIRTVKEFCQKNGLWLIEDNCDALGSAYDNKYTGSFGDIGTSSFYPPHHMTMGEGGAVYTSDPKLARIINSFRDWGRDCWCEPGADNTCGQRFAKQYGKLPFGYDHKYVYSHLGYNLKATDIQAAIGCEQLKKLPVFINERKKNFRLLFQGLKELENYFYLPVPEPDSDPSWFGFMLTLKEGCGFSRNRIVEYLEEKGIQTRNLFAGNLCLHPCFDN